MIRINSAFIMMTLALGFGFLMPLKAFENTEAPAWDLEFSGVLPDALVTVRVVENVPFQTEIKNGNATYLVQGRAKRQDKNHVLVDFAVRVSEGKNDGGDAWGTKIRARTPSAEPLKIPARGPGGKVVPGPSSGK